MGEPVEITIIISTYNRREKVKGAIESVLSQQGEAVSYEVIVVDNNSTDGTREAVREYEREAGVRYVFEERQGVSYARNAGIREARGEIIAFTDDDVRVSRGWVAAVKRAFDLHPDVDFIGGKILPHWNCAPPSWLTRDHWAPLALQDYGEQEMYSTARHPLCLPTANASFRRNAFERAGLFSPEFSGREDHELQVRLWRAGCKGLYVPDVVVTAEVQPERLTKAYHRRWFAETGRFNSMMRLDESIGRDGELMEAPEDAVTLFGASTFLYRELFAYLRRWIVAAAQGREGLSLLHETRVRYLIAYIRKRYEVNSSVRTHSHLAEIKGAAKALFRKKSGRAASI